MATAENIERKQGDTYPVEAFIRDEDDAGATIAYDLTGTTEIKLGLYTQKTVPDDQTAPTLVLTGTVTTPAEGKAEFPITAQEATDLAPGKYFAEIQFIQNTYIITTDTFEYKVEGQIIWA